MFPCAIGLPSFISKAGQSVAEAWHKIAALMYCRRVGETCLSLGHDAIWENPEAPKAPPDDDDDDDDDDHDHDHDDDDDDDDDECL